MISEALCKKDETRHSEYTRRRWFSEGIFPLLLHTQWLIPMEISYKLIIMTRCFVTQTLKLVGRLFVWFFHLTCLAIEWRGSGVECGSWGRGCALSSLLEELHWENNYRFIPLNSRSTVTLCAWPQGWHAQNRLRLTNMGKNGRDRLPLYDSTAFKL